ncbi:MAG: hypothetical protein JNK41_02470 [Saprospiraceae bacterium]|nr:hypothetical protein [Saprospiraceae bacterium]
MNQKSISIIIASAICITLFTQCKKEEIDIVDCSSVTPTYTLNIKFIMDANCVSSGCHNASSKKSGYDLSSYDATKSAGGNKAFVASVQHKSGYTKMPKGASKLSDADVKSITCWVQNGMPN